MFEFLKTKKYTLNNRLLIITDTSKLNKGSKKIIRKSLIKLFESETILLKFNTLYITFSDDKDLGKHLKEIANKLDVDILNSIGGTAEGNDRIILDFSYLLFATTKTPSMNLDYRVIEQKLKTVIVHEAVHLLHSQSNDIDGFLSKHYRQNDLMFAKIKKSLILMNKAHLMDYRAPMLRNMITGNMYKIWIEGVAKFYEELYLGKLTYQKVTFEGLYSEAKKIMNNAVSSYASAFRGILTNSQEERVVTDMVNVQVLSQIDSYAVGKHIIYSIKFFDTSISDEEILRLDVYKLMHLYEKIMLRNGYTPVISIYSSSGIFKYKKMIEFMQEMNKELKKRYS